MMRAGAVAALLMTAAAAVMSGLDAPHGLALRVNGDTSNSSGFFYFTASDEFEWSVASAGPLRVLVDGRVEVDRLTTGAELPVKFNRALDRGPHLIEIAHASGVTPALGWRDATAHVSTPVGASAFAPVLMSSSG